MDIFIVAQSNALCNKFSVVPRATAKSEWEHPELVEGCGLTSIRRWSHALQHTFFKKITASSGVRIAIRTPDFPFPKTGASGR